jgi:hypothetical protein
MTTALNNTRMTPLTPQVAIVKAAGPPTPMGANLLVIITTIRNSTNNGDKMIMDGISGM